MESQESQLGPTLVVLGVILVAVGVLAWTGALGWLGRLPGDIRLEGERTRVYVPITSMIVISVVLSVLLNCSAAFTDEDHRVAPYSLTAEGVTMVRQGLGPLALGRPTIPRRASGRACADRSPAVRLPVFCSHRPARAHSGCSGPRAPEA